MTVSNQSLDWSLLSAAPLNERFVLEEEPCLVYEIQFGSSELPILSKDGEVPPPAEWLGGVSPPPPTGGSLSSPPSSPRTVRTMMMDSSFHSDSDGMSGTAKHMSPSSVMMGSHRKDRDLQVAMRSVSAAESVDLAFVIDATGSMLKHIQNVKRSIRSIVTKCRRTHSSLRLRLAVVAYRDLSDAVPVEVLDFCSSVERFESFLTSLRAVGGGDTPEDMATGIFHANRLSWAHPTRLVFVVTDAPCHGVEFHGFDDDYPFGTPGVRIVSELQRLESSCSGVSDRENGAGGGIGSRSLYFGRISSSTDQMLHRLRTQYGIRLSVVAFPERHFQHHDHDSPRSGASICRNIP
jgi:hypothetical protein